MNGGNLGPQVYLSGNLCCKMTLIAYFVKKKNRENFETGATKAVIAITTFDK